MHNLEIIGKEIEIYKVKLLLFMTIAGGSWVYALKFDQVKLSIVLIFVFIIASFGIYVNILKLSSVEQELEGLKHD